MRVYVVVLVKTTFRYPFSSRNPSRVPQTSCAYLVKVFIVMVLCELGFKDDSSSTLAACVSFLYSVVRSSLLPRLIIGLEKEISIFFDIFGKLDVSVLFVKVVVESVNFVFVNGLVDHNFCENKRNRGPMVVLCGNYL